jgi:MFS family permease
MAAFLLIATWVTAFTTFLPEEKPEKQDGPVIAFPSKILIPLGMLAFASMVTEGIVNDWSAVYLKDVTSASASVASLGYFAFALCMVAIRAVTDRLVTKFNSATVIRVVSAIAFVGFALMLVAPIPAITVLGFGLVGIGVAAIVPVAWSAAGRLQPEAPAQAIAALATCGYFGFLVGPMIIGGLTSLIGLHYALLAALIPVGLGFFLAPATNRITPVTTVEATLARK